MMRPRNDQTYGNQVIDHSVHGLATIRLVCAPQQMVNAVIKELGHSQGAPSDEPDICVTFTDKIAGSGKLRLIGLNEAAFDDENFYLLDNMGRRIRVDFDRLGERCELVCERGVSAIPVLVPILGLLLLRKGYVLLHSSSFVYEDKGILVTGWQKGGKTEMLLPFMAAGAYYLADEWTIVSGEDGTLRGLSGIAQIWSWHLRYLPQFWARTKAIDRYRIRLVRLYQWLYRALPESLREWISPFPFLHRLSLEGGVSLLGQVRSSPQSLFGEHVWQGPANLDRVFFASAVQGETSVLPIESEEIARRMVASLAFERRELLTAYNQFRFAFPDRNNEHLETASEQELRLLSQALAGRPAYQIWHPYPVSLHELYEAAVPFCRDEFPEQVPDGSLKD
jgi:hypothetical protein